MAFGSKTAEEITAAANASEASVVADAAPAEKPSKEKKVKAPRAEKAPKAPKEKKGRLEKGEKAPKTKGARSKSTGIKKGGKEKAFVLLIGDEGAILVFMEGSKVVRRLFAMSPKPTHTEAILNLLQTNAKVPITILVDNIDQQYVRQSFPPVSSLSVNNLVQRRIDRDFQSEDLNGFLPVGRDKTGRKEWHFLLISLAKTEVLSEWIELIIELPTPLKGIYLAPVEATQYIPILSKASGLPADSDWQLMVTHNKISGFRQVVLHKGKLVFTRVTQTSDDAIPAVTAGNIEQEIISTIEYIKRLEFSANDSLDIIAIASAEVNESLDLKRFNLGETRKLSPLDVANALGLEQAALSADRFGDVVMAAAFLRTKKHILKFSTAYAKGLDKLYGIKKAIKLVSGLIILAMLGLSTQNILTSIENKSLASTSTEKRQALVTELSTLQKKVEGLDKNLAYKSAVVGMYDNYIKKELQPTAFVAALMPHLTPEERLISIEWTLNSAVKPGGGASTPAPSDKNAAVSIKTEFELKGNYVDMDALAKAAKAFVSDLTLAMPEYTITNEPFPWEKEKGKGLEISFDPQKSEGIKQGSEHIIIFFSGPKKIEPKPADAAPVGAAGAGPSGFTPNGAM